MTRYMSASSSKKSKSLTSVSQRYLSAPSTLTIGGEEIERYMPSLVPFELECSEGNEFEVILRTTQSLTPVTEGQ